MFEVGDARQMLQTNNSGLKAKVMGKRIREKVSPKLTVQRSLISIASVLLTEWVRTYLDPESSSFLPPS